MGEKKAGDRMPPEKAEVWGEDGPLAQAVCVFVPTADIKGPTKEGFLALKSNVRSAAHI